MWRFLKWYFTSRVQTVNTEGEKVLRIVGKRSAYQDLICDTFVERRSLKIVIYNQIWLYKNRYLTEVKGSIIPFRKSERG